MNLSYLKLFKYHRIVTCTCLIIGIFIIPLINNNNLRVIEELLEKSIKTNLFSLYLFLTEEYTFLINIIDKVILDGIIFSFTFILVAFSYLITSNIVLFLSKRFSKMQNLYNIYLSSLLLVIIGIALPIMINREPLNHLFKYDYLTIFTLFSLFFNITCNIIEIVLIKRENLLWYNETSKSNVLSKPLMVVGFGTVVFAGIFCYVDLIIYLIVNNINAKVKMNKENIKNILLIIGISSFIILFLFFETNIKKNMFSLMGYDTKEETIIKIDDFNLEFENNYFNNTLVLMKGELYSPNIKYKPSNLLLSQKKLTWSSDNPDIVYIGSSQTIIAKNYGNTTIRVVSAANNNIYREIKVKVVEKYNLLEYDNSLKTTKNYYSVGEIVKLDYKCEGIISSSSLLWETSDDNIATVIDGYLVARSMGEVKIKVTSLLNRNYSDEISVYIGGRHTTSKVEEIIFDPIVKVDKDLYYTSELSNHFIFTNQLITLKASTNQKLIPFTFFEISNSETVEIIENERGVFIFRCTEPNTYTVKAMSSVFPDVYETITFEVKVLSPGYYFNITSPKDIEIIDDVKVLNLSIDEVRQIKVESFYNVTYLDNLIISSTNSDVVEIKDDYIRALSNGSSVIKVVYKYNHEFTEEFIVNVVTNEGSIEINKLERISLFDSYLNSEKYNLNMLLDNYVYVGDELEFTLLGYPINYSYQEEIKVTFDNRIIDCNYIIYEGYVIFELIFKNIGNCELEIIFYSNPTQNKKILFISQNANLLDFEHDTIYPLERGQVANLNIKLINSLSKSITYTSSNPEIIAVGRYGELVALDYGEVIIGIEVSDGVTILDKHLTLISKQEESLFEEIDSFECKTVKEGKEIDLAVNNLFVNDTFEIITHAYPLNHPFGDYIKIKIIDNSILEYNKINGKHIIKAKNIGETSVIVYPYANNSLVVSFTVKVENIMPKFVMVTLPKETIYVGNRYQFGYLTDWRATYQNVDILISDKSIIEVDGDYIIPLKKGKVEMYVVVDDGSINCKYYRSNYTIEVLNPPLKIILAQRGINELLITLGLYFIIFFVFISQVISIGMKIFVEQKHKVLIPIIFAISLLVILFIIKNFIIRDIDIYEKYTSYIGIVLGMIFSFLVLLNPKKEKHYE